MHGNRSNRAKFSRSAALVIIGGICIAGAGYHFARTAIEATLRDDAIMTAENWGRYLGNAIKDIEDIAAGQPASEASEHLLQASRAIGNVFRYKIFDPDGRLVLISDDPDYTPEEASLSKHNPTAASVVATKMPHLEFKTGDGVERPLYYSEAYVPLQRNGRSVGTIEVYVDQAKSRAAMTATFRKLLLQIVGAILVAFAIPAAGFLMRSRQQIRTLDRLQHVAHHDDLTSAMNRTSFTDSMATLVRDDIPFAVHFLDLDRFKGVNDTLGHAIGDALLSEVVARLSRLGDSSTFIGRVGGDEFAVCQINADSERTGKFARLIVSALGLPFTVGQHEIQIGGSVGYSVFPGDGESAEDLIRAADVALYQAKSTGRGKAVKYEISMDDERQQRVLLEERLRHALQHSEFEIYYQPLFSTMDRRLRGFEALLRLRDDDGYLVPPDVFIPVAEEMGLITAVGEWVLNEATAFAQGWPGDLTVAVNLSAIQFETGRLVETVRNALEASDLTPSRLELEITESLLIKDPANVLGQLLELRSLGARIALDDFGTGYSSLSYLWKFPFDKLKIDRSFMLELEDADGKPREILKTIVALCRTLNLSVTAEGVETNEQLAALRELQCDQSQGFLLGRPMPASQIPSFMMSISSEPLSATVKEPLVGRAG
ncbi:putative bifunctional diguanylate cyclase/phosphodiesterase [Oricola cellulosilytica]|uniref:putative bifunctional diguanylate cyclase/phosphodiesterase n=1 Tax=Oricola cellulosilytica TaxID=1429082 RepID=UPI001304B381|nr:bifunctional diguanylate cyclase/phosphodiesterase [Oricola cellulosilytica]